MQINKEKNTNVLQKQLLFYICCPVCKGRLLHNNHTLKCNLCKHMYEVRKGIPVLTDKITPYLEQQINYFHDCSKEGPVFKGWMESYLNRFFENFRLKEKSLVLDIATGDGYIALELAKRGFRVIALDLSLSMLFKLKKELKHRDLENHVLLLCADATALPLKNNIADIVTANAILEHIPQEKKAIREINRVSKSNAGCMIVVPVAYRYLWPFFIPLNYYLDKKIGHLRRYTRNILEKKFSKWKTIRVYYTGNLFKVCLFILAYTLKIKFLTKILDELAEKVDKCFTGSPYGSSNITIFFRKSG